MLATIMLPGIVIQIPSYIIFYRLNWVDTPFPLIINSFFGGGAVTIFLFRQFMRTVPKELGEAARIDGMNTFLIYLTIVLPLCMPIVIYCMVTVFLSVWNDFMGPLIYLKKYSSYTLALGIYYRFGGEINNANRQNTQMATGLIMLVPCMLVFFIFQNKLIAGMAIGGIKE
jgi:multiple sugar transport system permease protein